MIKIIKSDHSFLENVKSLVFGVFQYMDFFERIIKFNKGSHECDGWLHFYKSMDEYVRGFMKKITGLRFKKTRKCGKINVKRRRLSITRRRLHTKKILSKERFSALLRYDEMRCFLIWM